MLPRKKEMIKQSLDLNPPKQALNRNREMTRRITDRDAMKINWKLRKLQNVSESILALLDDLEACRWQNGSAMTHVDMPYIALLANQEGYLADNKFFTLLSLWNGYKLYQKPLQAVMLRDKNGKFNHEFIKLLKMNLTMSPEATMALEMAQMMGANNDPLLLKSLYSYYLTNEQIEKFIQQIQTFPASEQVIFTVPERVNKLAATMPDSQTKIIDIICGQSVNFGALNRTTNWGQSLISLESACTGIIPSCSIVSAYPKIKFGDQAVEMRHILGYSSTSDIRDNGLFDQRDIGYHFPDMEDMPHEADYLIAKWLDFPRHDQYHAFAASAVLPAHRILMVRLSDETKALLAKRNYRRAMALAGLKNALPEDAFSLIKENSRGEEDRSLAHIADSFIDMEHSSCRANYSILNIGNKNEPVELLFLLSLILVLSRTSVANLDKAVRKHNKFATYTELASNTANELYQAICHGIIKYGDKNIINFISHHYGDLLAIYNEANTNPLMKLIKLTGQDNPLTTLTIAQSNNAKGFGNAWRQICTNSPALFDKKPETKLVLAQRNENTRKV